MGPEDNASSGSLFFVWRRPHRSSMYAPFSPGDLLAAGL